MRILFLILIILLCACAHQKPEPTITIRSSVPAWQVDEYTIGFRMLPADTTIAIAEDK